MKKKLFEINGTWFSEKEYRKLVSAFSLRAEACEENKEWLEEQEWLVLLGKIIQSIKLEEKSL